MSVTATPYGFRPIRKIGGQPYTGGFSRYKIKTGAAAMWQGDPVEFDAGAGIIRDASTTAWTADPIGIFVGCEYTDPNLGYKVFRNTWPVSTAATDGWAYVVDDPDVVFQIQTDLTGTVTDYWVGSNVAIVSNTGSTTTGMSAVVVDKDSNSTANTLPLRVVGIVNDPTNVDMTKYVDLEVVILGHALRLSGSGTGVAST